MQCTCLLDIRKYDSFNTTYKVFIKTQKIKEKITYWMFSFRYLVAFRALAERDV